MRLSDEAADAIACNHPFLGVEDLDVAGCSSAKDCYAFIGYPQSRFRQRPENRLKFAGAMYELSGATEDKYRQLRLDSSIQIVANYDPQTYRDKDGRKITPLHPSGLSGGGIWTLQTKESESAGFHDPKLAGIFIEWRAEDKAMVGVRVNVLVGSMARAFANTRRLFFSEALLPEIKDIVS
jgi:hypothetical protein